VVGNSVGANFEANFAYLPADGMRGVAARSSIMQISNPICSNHSISVFVLGCKRNLTWILTGVYGPQEELEKKLFIRELRHLKVSAPSLWLLLGDFNLIYKAQDKNNANLNHMLMHRFRRALNYLELKEIQVKGRTFTWSNNQNPPTMTRIDRAFCTTAWENCYSNPILQAQSSSSSDHCSLLLLPLVVPRIQPKFRFESHWPQMPGFLDVVSETWSRIIPQHLNPMAVLHTKLSRTTKKLRIWSRSLHPHGKLVMVICREVIH
jgi:hypothetical protein